MEHEYNKGSEWRKWNLHLPYSKETAILYKQGIREHVCEMLEGGVDAFKKREEKYHIQK